MESGAHGADGRCLSGLFGGGVGNEVADLMACGGLLPHPLSSLFPVINHSWYYVSDLNGWKMLILHLCLWHYA